MNRAAVLTTGRQDFGIIRSMVEALRDAPDFELQLIVGGMHLSSRFGSTVDSVIAEGFEIAATVDSVAEPPAAAADTGRALSMLDETLRTLQPDFLLLVGDRAETLAAGIAATLNRIPIVHLHGGEESEGAVDNAFRHALTKLAHLHLVTHPLHARRVIQMGEPEENVYVVGAPGLDNLYSAVLPDPEEVVGRIGLDLGDGPLVLVTVHPATLGPGADEEVREVAAAMAEVDATYIVTQPNADEGGVRIREFWCDWAAGRPRVAVVDALGERAYWALLRRANVVLGNSSSGIIEAPSAGAITINVGDRQRGRLRAASVIDAPAERDAIRDSLRRALESPGQEPPEPLFQAGPAAPRMLAAIREWLPRRSPRKVFQLREGRRLDAPEAERPPSN